MGGSEDHRPQAVDWGEGFSSKFCLVDHGNAEPSGIANTDANHAWTCVGSGFMRVLDEGPQTGGKVELYDC